MSKLRCSLYLIFLSLLFSCASSPKVYENDYTYLYDKGTKIIKPQFKIFHHSADSSSLFFRIKSDDILYGKFSADSSSEARIKVRYYVRALGADSQILDSATVSLADIGINNENKTLQSSLIFRADTGRQYRLEVRFRDDYKDFNVVHKLTVDKRINTNPEFFIVRQEGRILMNNYSDFGRQLEIQKSPLIQENSFLAERANPHFTKAAPPFATGSVEPKLFETAFSDTIEFREGLAKLFLNDEVSRLRPLNSPAASKLYLYYYYDGFPSIVGFDQVLEPLRYISTTNEYNSMMEAADSRNAFEKFWLKLARDQTAAKKMISEYYRRVEVANENFTSYKEGWKTDRGIIYIVYGQPYEVRIEGNRELWLYGEEANILSVKFQFIRVQSDWSDKDFQLLRDENYKNNWYRAVDVWRQGRIY